MKGQNYNQNQMEINELKYGENEIKTNLLKTKDNINYTFKKYGLLDKNWYEKYNNYLYNK